MKVYLDTIGCRLNQSEIEKMAGQFRAAGHLLVDNPAIADLVVVNTCAVTTQAASDSRQKIRQASRAGVGKIVVTGCWATLQPEAAEDMPAVMQVITNSQKNQLVSDLLDIPQEIFDREPIARQPLPGSHKRTRAFIKAQEGCNNFCTFCITRLLRGEARSMPLEGLLRDIRSAVAGGAQEIVLTGVHLGAWGSDLNPSAHISMLVHTILAETDFPRLRLSSIEPWDLDNDFFSLWQNPRMCRHLHLPLQSGCDATLQRMGRKTTQATYLDLIKTARSAIPDVAITTDIIAGFPGETAAEFSESLEFIREMVFAGGHVFHYSPRPGTPAARLPGQVPGGIMKQRSIVLRQVLAESSLVFQRPFLGRVLPVLWEVAEPHDTGTWSLEGHTGNYLRVKHVSPENLWNKMTDIRLTELTADGFYGELECP
jgi:threonylcarbamoyladenosine tRNA methylthiotransferase MtaB